jgi:hypothetical protein
MQLIMCKREILLIKNVFFIKNHAFKVVLREHHVLLKLLFLIKQQLIQILGKLDKNK